MVVAAGMVTFTLVQMNYAGVLKVLWHLFFVADERKKINKSKSQLHPTKLVYLCWN